MMYRGERLEWNAIPPLLPDGTTPPHSDFKWLSRDSEDWELKSPVLGGWARRKTTSQYRTIPSAISEVADKKKYFIIDIGDELLSDDLAASLSEYNERRLGVPRIPVPQGTKARVAARGRTPAAGARGRLRRRVAERAGAGGPGRGRDLDARLPRRPSGGGLQRAALAADRDERGTA